MRAALRVITMILSFPIAAAHAGGQLLVADLPPPIRDYAEGLKPYCEVLGKRGVTVNGIYSDRLFGYLDINHDGRRDYLIYKCMFGCDDEPYALQGLGPQCMFGRLLVSSGAGYTSVPVPGQLSNIDRAPRLRVAVYRERINAPDCGGQWYCNYVYELRENWFRLVGTCPPKGCASLLSALPEDDGRQAAVAPGGGD